MDTEIDPSTQDTADNAAEQQPQTIPIERFNEVYAASKAQERMVEQLMAQNQQFMAQLATQGSRGQQQEEQIEIDPEDEKKFGYLLKKFTSPLEQQIQQLTGVLNQQQVNQFAQNVDPAVAKRANELINGWRASGYNGWTPQDAVIYAAGELAVNGKKNQQTAQAARQNFNRGSPVVSGHAGGAGAGGKQIDLNNLSLDEQVAALEQNLDGVEF